MAQYAILRFEKHKGNPARPLEAHHERQKEQYASNPDIDTSRSKYNFHIVKPEGHYYHFIQSRIGTVRIWGMVVAVSLISCDKLCDDVLYLEQ